MSRRTLRSVKIPDGERDDRGQEEELAGEQDVLDPLDRYHVVGDSNCSERPERKVEPPSLSGILAPAPEIDHRERAEHEDG